VTTVSGNSALLPITLPIGREVNDAPAFASSLISTVSISIKKDATGRVIEGESFSYTSPTASDTERDSIDMVFMGLTAAPCATVSRNGDDSFTLSIAAVDVDETCAGSHNLAIVMGDAHNRGSLTASITITIGFEQVEAQEESSEDSNSESTDGDGEGTSTEESEGSSSTGESSSSGGSSSSSTGAGSTGGSSTPSDGSIGS
jgi:hypothetical protein